MKKLALLCLSPIVLANVAFAGGQNAPAYKHEARPHHHHHAAPRLFNGFSITGALGGITAQLDATQNFAGQSVAGDGATVAPTLYGFTAENNETSSDKLELAEANIAGSIGIEYAYQFHNGFLLGLAATAGFNNVEFDNTLNTFDHAFTTDDTNHFDNYTNVSSTLNVELENDFALLFKAGFVVRHNTLIYALVGPRWGNFESTLNSSYNNNGSTDVGCGLGPFAKCDNAWDATLTDSSSNSEYQLGVTAGVGIRQALSEHFMLGLEYAYTHYGDLDSLANGGDNVFLDSNYPVSVDSGTNLHLQYADNAQDMSSSTSVIVATLSYRF